MKKTTRCLEKPLRSKSFLLRRNNPCSDHATHAERRAYGRRRGKGQGCACMRFLKWKQTTADGDHGGHGGGRSFVFPRSTRRNTLWRRSRRLNLTTLTSLSLFVRFYHLFAFTRPPSSTYSPQLAPSPYRGIPPLIILLIIREHRNGSSSLA